MSGSPDVIVVGGGVIGCSIAFHLAKAGVRPLVLERGRLGKGATHAATGTVMGAPGDGPLDRLQAKSYAMFRTMATEIRELGGVDPDLVKCGRISVAMHEEEAQDLRVGADPDGHATWLDRDSARDVEPALSDAILGGLYVREAYRADGLLLTESLARAAVQLGAEVRQGTEVVALEESDGRVTGVRLREGSVHAAHVVLAAGAWSQAIAAWSDVRVPVKPVRGQNISLRPATESPRVTINWSDSNVVARSDGSVFAGVTVEEVGFDDSVTGEGVHSILARAIQAVPSMKDATLRWAVAGLRPAPADDMPILGPVSSREGLYVATGHHRSGISLSAITGQLIAGHIAGEDTTIPDELSPDRFQ